MQAQKGLDLDGRPVYHHALCRLNQVKPSGFNELIIERLTWTKTYEELKISLLTKIHTSVFSLLFITLYFLRLKATGSITTVFMRKACSYLQSLTAARPNRTNRNQGRSHVVERVNPRSAHLPVDPEPSRRGTAPTHPWVYQLKREPKDHTEQLGHLGPERNPQLECVDSSRTKEINLNRICTTCNLYHRKMRPLLPVACCIQSRVKCRTHVDILQTHLSAAWPDGIWFFSAPPISPQRPPAKNVSRLIYNRRLSDFPNLMIALRKRCVCHFLEARVPFVQILCLLTRTASQLKGRVS